MEGVSPSWDVAVPSPLWISLGSLNRQAPPRPLLPPFPHSTQRGLLKQESRSHPPLASNPPTASQQGEEIENSHPASDPAGFPAHISYLSALPGRYILGSRPRCSPVRPLPRVRPRTLQNSPTTHLGFCKSPLAIRFVRLPLGRFSPAECKLPGAAILPLSFSIDSIPGPNSCSINT